MTLFFKSSRGERREVGNINEALPAKEQLRVAGELINGYVKKLNPDYKIPYMRVYNIAQTAMGEIYNGEIVTHFDVGSWSEYFFVYPAIIVEEKYKVA